MKKKYTIENALTFFEGYSMFVALYITASLPIDFALKDFIFGIPFSEYDI